MLYSTFQRLCCIYFPTSDTQLYQYRALDHRYLLINSNNSLVYLSNDLSAHRKITDPSYGTVYLTSQIPVLRTAEDCPEFRYFSEDLHLAGDAHTIGISSDFIPTFINIEGNLWFINVLAGSQGQLLYSNSTKSTLNFKKNNATGFFVTPLDSSFLYGSHVLRSSREFSTSLVMTNNFRFTPISISLPDFNVTADLHVPSLRLFTLNSTTKYSGKLSELRQSVVILLQHSLKFSTYHFI